MKRAVSLIIFFISLFGFAQTLHLNSQNYGYKNNDEFFNDLFLGVTKIQFDFDKNQPVLGKEYKIVIREYRDGKLFQEKVVVQNKTQKNYVIEEGFKFTIISQQVLNTLKIGFFFDEFMSKQPFKINDKFPDGTFDLRNLTGGTGKLDFKLGEEFQLALVTPPNDNVEAGTLGYCEVSKGNIDITSWYSKYKISQFFLIYMTIK